MTQGPTVLMNFKDLPREEELRESIEERCQRMAADFSEITRFEFTLSEDGNGFIVRMYESLRRRGNATVRTAFNLREAHKTNLREQTSRNGRFLSLTFTVTATDREGLDNLYRALSADKRFLMVL